MPVKLSMHDALSKVDRGEEINISTTVSGKRFTVSLILRARIDARTWARDIVFLGRCLRCRDANKNKPLRFLKNPVQLAPLPVPADLIADVYIPNPDVTWAKARVAVGGPAMFLPTSTGALAELFGLPLTVGGEIDGNIPVVGAVLERRDGGKGPHG